MVPTLAPHASSQSLESHVPEEIPCVLPRPKSQDGDIHWVCERCALAAVAGAAAGIRVVVFLKATTAYAASDATSTAAASTGSCNLLRHCQLNLHGLRSPGGQENGRRAPHVMLPDEGSEGGVQARWAVVGKEPELVTEMLEEDGGEGDQLG